MQDAGRATLLADDRPLLAADVEALASAYLDAADGNPSVALRLAAADRISDLDRMHARVAELQALVSRGFSAVGEGPWLASGTRFARPATETLVWTLGDVRPRKQSNLRLELRIARNRG
jgi:hypothetical protein